MGLSASFNAPIAGALFAGDVVIGHYALNTFAPVVLASVAGTVMSRAYYGNFPAFVLPPHEVGSYVQFPLYIILGVLAGLCVTFLLRGIFKAQKIGEAFPIVSWAPITGHFWSVATKNAIRKADHGFPIHPRAIYSL